MPICMPKRWGGHVATNRFDQLALMVADAERSLEGLTRSLQIGSEDMKQAALHALDLSGALSLLGLGTAAGLLEDVARQMTLGQPSVLDLAQGLLPLVAQAIKDVQLGHAPESDEQLQAWAPWSSRLQVLVSRDTASLTSFVAVMPKASALQYVGAADPGFRALRMKGLNLIQNARILNQRDDERTIRQMDALLSELQDWSLRVGQVPLTQLFPQFAHDMQDVWLDASLMDRLDPLRDFGAKAKSIQAHSRSLTIYMNWQGLSLSDKEYLQMGQCLRAVSGHVQRIQDGYGLVFPCSLTRMRLMPFLRNEQRYAVAASQFVQFQPQEAQAGFAGSLMLRSGVDTLSMQADRALPAENMNIFDVPEGTVRPEGVFGVALDGAGEIYFCLSPK